MVEPQVVRIVEAALFSAGKPLLVDELADSTKLTKEQVRDACKALEKEYEASPNALEVAKAGDKWAMQLKAQWAPHAAKLAPMEVPAKTLKTLALIAFHQPILQSELKRMVGERVYDHMHELHERGLVVAREHGQTKIVTTSDRFPEYFGIPETEPDRIRTFLADKLGIKVAPKQVEADIAKAAAEGAVVAPEAAPTEGALEGEGQAPEPDGEAPPAPAA
ncbi:MAG TPA: SMC-Scp complex subunit ScpB [Candidatus Thermoplasmatota archaeon]|jgi:segregation and condensation protein B|nr:SMC-Scp complex subunit ScpB [Candidatus Thermoplasmatota archaeon]